LLPVTEPAGQPRPTKTTSPEKVLYVGLGANVETVEGRFSPGNALLVTYGW
jgi:hypothetical protein